MSSRYLKYFQQTTKTSLWGGRKGGTSRCDSSPAHSWRGFSALPIRPVISTARFQLVAARCFDSSGRRQDDSPTACTAVERFVVAAWDALSAAAGGSRQRAPPIVGNAPATRRPGSAQGSPLSEGCSFRCSNLHFSPRGEAKCVRGPSGRGARRLARAGVLYGSPAISHFFWSKPGPLPMLFTNHETRNTNHGLFPRASTVGW